MGTFDRLKRPKVSTTEHSRRRRIFPDTWNWEAVAAISGGHSASQVAAEIGLSKWLVRVKLRWAEGRGPLGSSAPGMTPPHAQATPTHRVGPSPADHAAHIARLCKELGRFRMEREILKRAAHIFGRATGGR
jgi:transposase